MNAAEAMERVRRWTAVHKSRVTHPKYGSVIVPHLSKMAAMENAAEFWNCDIMEILGSATVEWVAQEEGPMRRPKEFYRKREEPGTETSKGEDA